MAPAPGQSAGVALLSIDGKPPKAIRVGGVVDGDMVLQDISQRSARIGPQDGANFLTIDLPGLPPAATGTLPPPSGVTQASPPGQGMPAGSYRDLYLCHLFVKPGAYDLTLIDLARLTRSTSRRRRVKDLAALQWSARGLCSHADLWRGLLRYGGGRKLALPAPRLPQYRR